MSQVHVSEEIKHDVMESQLSRYARDYVIPIVVFILMVYYLLFHVIIPMWQIGFPIHRRKREQIKTVKSNSQVENQATQNKKD